MKKTFLLLILLVIAFLGLDLMIKYGCGIPPQGLTDAHMWGMKRRILRYAHTHNQLPTDMKNLPQMPGYANEITDWWGNPIRVQIDSDGIVTLSSDGGPAYFRDEREGLPIVRRFNSKTPAGEWSDELVDFIKE